MNESNRTVDLTTAEIVVHDIKFYYTPILVYLGSLGNCLSVYVFFCTKLRKSSSSMYLGALAISDTGFLISLFIAWLTMVDIMLFTKQGFCQFFIYLTTLCSFLSVWFVVAFTVERFIAVQYPLRRQSMCTSERAKHTVSGITILGGIICIPLFWYAGPRVIEIPEKGSITMCHLAEGWESYATVFNIMDTLLTFVLPFNIIVVLNALIVRAIYKLASIRRSMTVESRHTQDGQTCSNNPRSGVSQTKITKMLLIVSSVFLCFNLPAYVIRVIAILGYEENSTTATELAQIICNLLFDTNFGINFVLYCASGQNFRKAMTRLICRKSSKRNAIIIQMSQLNHNNSQIGQSSKRQRTIVITESWKDLQEMQALSK